MPDSKAPIILQVCPALHEGGVERSVVEMATYCLEHGVVPMVASNGGKLVAELDAAGVPHFKLPLQYKNPLIVFLNIWRLAWLIKREGVDLIHVRSRAPAWAIFWANKLTGVPFITTFHGTYGVTGFGKKLYNSGMLRGQVVIANSKFIRQHIIDNYNYLGDFTEIPVAPRGFDEVVFQPTAVKTKDILEFKDKHNIPANAQVVLMAGRLARWKGQHILLKALTKITDLEWVAVFAGGAGKKPAYFEELKTLSDKSKISGKVIWLGSWENMPLLYKMADVVISASTKPEAFGRVAVEAQAMETPVIATAHGGSVETVQDGTTGWLITPDSSSEMAEKLRLALTDSVNLVKMGKAARKWVSANFTATATCEKEFAVYEKILGLDTKEK